MRTIHARSILTIQVLMITAALGLGAVPTHAGPDQALPPEVEALKGELARMQTVLDTVMKEQEQLRQLLSRRPSTPLRPPEVVVDIGVAGSPTLGDPEAPLTLIEFSDYQCPSCRRFFETTLPGLKAEYIDTGKLHYVFRDFPLDRIHRQARKAAEAAHCAGDQGKYWEMHDLLFQHQRALQPERLQAYARQLGLDAVAFDACLEEGKYGQAVQTAVEEGTTAGIQGTPGFFLGTLSGEGKLHGTFIKGAQPIAAFRQAIDRVRNGQEPISQP